MDIEYKNGIKYFRCLKRGRLIKATPEEEVRQQLLKTLLSDLKVPKDMLHVEERISKYGVETKDRVDIVIDYETEEYCYPLVIIECKRPEIPLTYQVMQQLERYNDHFVVNEFAAKVLGMTNGHTIDWFLLGEDNQYKQVETPPDYQQIIEGQGFTYIKNNSYISSVQDEDFEDVPTFIRPFVMNISNLFLNEQYVISSIIGEGFKIVEDKGLRLESNGNASGGNWDGEYRCLLLNSEDFNNVSTDDTNHFTMGFCVFPSETPYLACSFDNNITPNHNSLQLRLNDWLRIKGSKVEVWHDGTITIGHLGRAKREGLIMFVASIYPELVVNNHIFLGELDNSKKLSFSDEDVELFMSNLIKYVLCREKFRIEFKRINSTRDFLSIEPLSIKT